MRLNINIPTRGRPQKLSKCLKSIDYVGDMKIFLCCYCQREDIPLKLPDLPIEIIEDPDMLTIESHNLICRQPGHFMGLSDDIEFFPVALNEAVYALECVYGGYGALDFVVANMDSPDGCYMLLSDDFIEGFPGRQPYCPEYKFMFASAELRDYAKSINCFYRCHDAKLNHYHPAVTGQADRTHDRIRSKGVINHDQAIYARRKANGDLWSHSVKG